MNHCSQSLKTITAAAFLLIASLCSAMAADAQRDCTPEEKASGDRQLRLSTKDKEAAAAKHAPWGLAVSKVDASKEVLLMQRDYLLDYDGDLRSPIWVAYKLDANRLGKADRIDCFRPDPRLKPESASAPSDYDEPIFDQGHIAPNGDMSNSNNSVVNSFIQSNMAPQFCQFNRGVWQILESLVRHWGKTHRVQYVMSGAIFDQDGDHARDSDANAPRMRSNNKKKRVAIASAFYKIVIWEDENDKLHSISFLLPHDQTDLDKGPAIDYLENHITKLTAIEQEASLNIMPDLAAQPQEADKLWPHEGFVSHSLVNSVCRKTAGMQP